MKKKILTLLLVVSLGIISGCSTTNQTSSNQENTEQETVSYPYEFIDSKTETAGSNTNKMDLYAFSGEIELTNLKQFLREKKQSFKNGTFYYVVIFDKSENATFPQDPFTAAYGLEEEPQKHIRAFYTYNKLNGYSKLDYYEGNKWESLAQTEDI